MRCVLCSAEVHKAHKLHWSLPPPHHKSCSASMRHMREWTKQYVRMTATTAQLLMKLQHAHESVSEVSCNQLQPPTHLGTDHGSAQLQSKFAGANSVISCLYTAGKRHQLA